MVALAPQALRVLRSAFAPDRRYWRLTFARQRGMHALNSVTCVAVSGMGHQRIRRTRWSSPAFKDDLLGSMPTSVSPGADLPAATCAVLPRQRRGLPADHRLHSKRAVSVVVVVSAEDC